MKEKDKVTGVKILFIIAILLGFVLTGCANTTKPKKEFNPIVNAKELGKALGCVFAPHTCKSAQEKIKDEKAFQEEFKKIDEQLKKDSKTTPK
jgi:hypothetical protein